MASTVSPLQIQARQTDVCRSCTGKECVNGSASTPGCGTELYVPQIRSNIDCVFCLDCARACPYDNVALAPRPPLHELAAGAWPQRWDLGFLALLFAFAGLGNAFGMVPPVYALEAALSQWLPFLGEAAILLLIFGAVNLVLPAVLGVLSAVLSRRLSGSPEPVRVAFIRYSPALMPLAFAIWLAHYGFHFATGGLTIIPVLQSLLASFGLSVQPNWMLGPLLPSGWLLPLMVLFLVAGLLGSLYVAGERVRSDDKAQRPALGALPWIILLVTMAVAALLILTQPMEMRGTWGVAG
jgi:hypothetical protein